MKWGQAKPELKFSLSPFLYYILLLLYNSSPLNNLRISSISGKALRNLLAMASKLDIVTNIHKIISSYVYSVKKNHVIQAAHVRVAHLYH